MPKIKMKMIHYSKNKRSHKFNNIWQTTEDSIETNFVLRLYDKDFKIKKNINKKSKIILKITTKKEIFIEDIKILIKYQLVILEFEHKII